MGDGARRCRRLLRTSGPQPCRRHPAEPAQALTTYFAFLELRYKVELYQPTGRVVECPLDELNRPRGSGRMSLRIPPSEQEIQALFSGWREELLDCRKYAPAARNYAAARLMADVGLRLNEVRSLDLADVKWDLGRFGKLHVRHGKGANGSGPRQRMAPLINGAGRTLAWFIEDVWSRFDDDPSRPGAPLFPSERKNADGSCARVGGEALRAELAAVTGRHLAAWSGTVTPHLLRLHMPPSSTCRAWTCSPSRSCSNMPGSLRRCYVHMHRTHIEDAWIAGQQRAAQRLKGLLP